MALNAKVAFVVALSSVIVLIYAKSLIRTKRWEEFPDVEFHFQCSNRTMGFYADMEFDCQIFHMCDNYGRRIPHICPNETAFNQKYRVCDWESNVECNDSPSWFYLNDLTYEKPPGDDEDL